jgi:chromosome segregation ATPase
MKPNPEQAKDVEAVERPDQVERVAVVCPICQATLAVRRAYIGKAVQCKQCNQTFVVRDPSAQATEPISGEGETIPKSNYYQIEGNSASPVTLAELDRLRAENAALLTEQKRLQTERTQHAASHGHYKLKCTQVEERLNQVTSELDTIRTLLGTVAPEEVQGIKDERESLRAELNVLREANHALNDEKSPREHLASDLERRESEIETGRVERDSLAERLKQREDELVAIRAECESHKQRFRQRDSELATLRAEHRSLGTQLQEALNEADQSRAAFEDRAHAFEDERDKLRAELEALHGNLDRADLAHRAERDGIRADLDALNDQYRRLLAEKESTDRLLTQQRDESQALVLAQDKLKSDHQSLLDSMQSRTEELDAAPAPESPALIAEIEALRGQVADLTQRLADADLAHSATIQTLRQLGIHPVAAAGLRRPSASPMQPR